MIDVVRPRMRDIFQDFFSIQSQSFGNCQQSLGAECTLRVYVQAFSFATAHGHGKLTSDGYSMADLGLSSSEFTKKLRQGASFDTTTE